MSFENIGSPVVIIGMHRSGTTMLTEFLAAKEIFTGELVEQNGESISFLKLNEKILHSLGLAWHDVADIESCISKRKKELVAEYRKSIGKKAFQKRFFGSGAQVLTNDYSWGWKDPRNTLLIDVISEVFPGAKYIHIVRNPVDVANSLRVRERRFSAGGLLRWYYHVIKNLLSKRIFIRRSPKLMDINKGYALWKEYVGSAIRYKGDVLHIRYEDFLDSPSSKFQEINEFLGLKEADDKFIDRVGESVDITRKYSFINDVDLCEFYSNIRCDDLVKETGYGDILSEYAQKVR